MAATETLVLSVKGMHCKSCPALIDDDLVDVAGVETATTELDAERTTVVYDPQQTTPQALVDVVRAAGEAYVVEVVA